MPFDGAGPRWVDRLQASADFMGPGSIIVNLYEAEILDMVRRESVFRQRIEARQARGHPHRYIEQLGIGIGSFSDPRDLSPVPTSPTRVERSVMIKAITNQLNLTLFDVLVTQQQNQFPGLDVKDVQDVVNGVIVAAASAYWTGTDTSLAAPTTLQYVGALTQITLQATISPGSSIVDGLKAMVSRMMANTLFKPRPTAIYLNPMLGHYLDTEMRATNIQLQTVVIGGVTVRGIETQAGVLPLIPDPYLPNSTTAAYGFGAPPTGYANWYAVITTENMIERPYITGPTQSAEPMLFRLGLGNSLQGQYVAAQFDAIVVKGASYAHAVVAVQAPV